MNEAFVYKLTYKPTLDWYVGFHTGTEDDGYVCSSKVVMNLYNIDPTDWERTIIQKGSTKEMHMLETTILQTMNARKDIRSFNRHNNDNKATPGWNKGIPMKNETKEIQRNQRLGKSTAKKGRKYPGSHSAEANLKKSEQLKGNNRRQPKGQPWTEARRLAYETKQINSKVRLSNKLNNIKENNHE